MSMLTDYATAMAKIWDQDDTDCSTASIRRALDELTAAMKAKGWPKASAELTIDDRDVTIALRVVPVATPSKDEPAAFGENAWTFPSASTVSDVLAKARKAIAERLTENPAIATAPWWDMAQLGERAAS